MTIINQLNAANRKRVVEVNNTPSKTIPEQSLSVKQIIDRFTKGLPITAKNYEAQYHGGIEMPVLDKLDLAEQQQLREYARDKVKEFQNRINEEIATKKALQEKEFNDWKAAKEAQSNNQSNQGTNATQTEEA